MNKRSASTTLPDVEAPAHGPGVVVVIEKSENDNDNDNDNGSLPDGASVTTSVRIAPSRAIPLDAARWALYPWQPVGVRRNAGPRPRGR